MSRVTSYKTVDSGRSASLNCFFSLFPKYENKGKKILHTPLRPAVLPGRICSLLRANFQRDAVELRKQLAHVPYASTLERNHGQHGFCCALACLPACLPARQPALEGIHAGRTLGKPRKMFHVEGLGFSSVSSLFTSLLFVMGAILRVTLSRRNLRGLRCTSQP